MDYIINFFKDIYNNIVSVFSAILHWLIDLVTSACDSLLETITDSIPDLSNFWNNLQVVSEYTSFINVFFPLREAVILIAAYFAFISVFIIVKLTIKIFIPFVG